MTASPGHGDAAPARGRPARTPRWLRIVFMATFFFAFFFGSPVIALVIFPFIRLTSRDLSEHRRRCTRLLHRGMRGIARAARFVGMVDLDLTPLPASVDRSRPYVMVSNHPSFIDMMVILGTFEELTCVTKGSWSRHWALGRLLRSTNYLPGPGSGLPESEDMLDTMVAHLRAGFSLLVFPEGQRSMTDQLRRFRRGAVEAATRAGVPIVPLYLALDPPYLTKAVPLWKPPPRPPTYAFEWFDVVRPEAFGHDARRIQEHLVALYEARFRQVRAPAPALSPAASTAPA